MKKINIKVYGQVQGVFFRYTTRKLARKLGLTGFVKNMPDGSVYIEAEGPEAKLYDLLEFSKVGPKYAYVKQVEFEFGEPENKYKGFEYSY
ncbi:MAG: acylphosphatase [Promethearchaeota archaeon]